MPDTPAPADRPSSGATAPSSGVAAPSQVASSAPSTTPVAADSAAPTMTVNVPQQDGEITFFDGAFHRVYQVVGGAVKVAVEDVEHFLGHVTGASIAEPVTGP